MKLILYLSCTVFYLSGGLYLINSYKWLQPYLLLISMTMIFTVFIISNKRNIVISKGMLLSFLCYFVSSFLSGVINMDKSLLLGSVLMIYIYFITNIACPKIVFINDQNIKLYSTILISYLPLLFLPLFINPIRLSSYSGIFSNSNSLGNTAVTILMISLAELLYFMDNHLQGLRRSPLKLVFYSFVNAVAFLLVILSSSRTSFITAMGLYLIGIAIFLMRTIKLRKITINSFTKSIIIFVAIVLLGIILLNYFNVSDLINNNIIHKFVVKSKTSDVFGGRSYVWRTTLREATLFGHGRDYFDRIGLGAHNTFISIIGQYGIFSALFLAVFMIIVLYKSFVLALSREVYHFKYLPLLSITSFFALSMAEGMMLKLNMLVMFTAISFMNYYLANNIQGKQSHYKLII